jgi:hypothetical protein
MQWIFYVVKHINRRSPSRLATVQFAVVNCIAFISGVGSGVVLFDVLESDHGFSAIAEKFSEISKYFQVITK